MEENKLKGEYISESAAETRKIASDLAKKINPPKVFALYGDLGAGKTTFIQGLAAGFGIKERVFSPTFVFIRPHKATNSGRRQKIETFYHVDLYRAEDLADVESLGLGEIFSDPESITAVEWAEKCDKILPEKSTIKIRMKAVNESTRQIVITPAANYC